MLSLAITHAAAGKQMTQLTSTTSQANQVLVTSENFRELYGWNTATQQLELIDPNCAGQQINFSADGRLLAFKRFQKAGNQLWQVPVLFDVQSGQKIDLTEPVDAAGVPSISEDGRIVVTIGNELHVFNRNRQRLRKYNLGYYANLTPISPDGKIVVFNDLSDQLWLIELESGARTKLTADRVGYFNPVWSPDSRRLAASTLAGELVIWEIALRRELELGPGESPNWTPDGNWLIFRSIQKNARLEITHSEISRVRSDGQQRTDLTQTADQLESTPRLTPDGSTLVYEISAEKKMYQIRLNWHGARSEMKLFRQIELPELPSSQNRELNEIESAIKILSPNSVYFDAPYVHQVYDVPDWFDGHSACGATSAIMGLAYYKILPPWPCTASYPTLHTSDYGRYICEIYEFNGFRYAIAGYDASDRLGYGGYGFIIQHDWADTKGYMAQYVRQHGLGSSVDWAPSLAKAMVDVDHQYPFVLLNSLTTSGHYILVVGYVAEKHQLIVNDPYGNKNLGYKNYKGKLAVYDWPGYYNGYSNLNTVHCYIYLRQAPDLAAKPFAFPDTLTLGETAPISTWIHNSGLRPADSVGVGFYWVESITGSPTEPAQTRVMLEQLAVGDSVRIHGEIKIPDSTYSGLHGLAISVDDFHEIPETSESNNYVMAQVVVKGFPYLAGSRPLPNQEISDTTPKIVARFQDIISGIDLNSLKLFLDAANFTDSCSVSDRLLTFQPIAPLAFGEHTVTAQATNLAGFTAQTSWKFSITPPAGIAGNKNQLLPDQPYLWQNYPNPFNQQTILRYNVPQTSRVELDIFDVTGRRVRTLVQQSQPAGQYQVVWDGLEATARPAASGIYFLRLKIGRTERLRSMVLLK
jgi:flagellar hook assembly protein FlgD